MKQLELPLEFAKEPQPPVQLDLFDLEPYTKPTWQQMLDALSEITGGVVTKPFELNSVPLEFTVDPSKNIFANEAKDEAIQNDSTVAVP